MSASHLVESLGEMGVNLDVTDKGKLRIVSNQEFITTSEFEQLKNSKTEIVSYLNHKKAEGLVNSLKLHDDRIFVHQCLNGIYGTKRLEIVNKYLEQWQQGSSAEPINIKKDNAGRYQANTWFRKSLERN
jgi:hypothetical protein